MENNNLSIEYKITYSNHFYWEGFKLAFRKKELFEISEIPSHVKRTNQGWWFGKKLLTPDVVSSLIKMDPIEIDVSNLQWYIQEQLNHVFNL